MSSVQWSVGPIDFQKILALRNIHKSEEEKQTCRKEENNLDGGKDGKIFWVRRQKQKGNRLQSKYRSEGASAVWRDRWDRVMLMLVLILKRRDECK